jgi:hypothetical protein
LPAPLVLYEKIFKFLEEDFNPRGLNLQNQRDINKFKQYIELRDNWLKKENIQNFTMSLILTRLLHLILIDNIYSAQKYDDVEEYRRFNKEHIKKIIVSKSVMFPILDNINKIKNKNWKPLIEFENGNISEGKNKGWCNYIRSHRLNYHTDTSINLHILMNKDTLPLYGGIGLKSLIKKTDIDKIIIQLADLIDLGRIVQFTFNAISINDCKFDERKVNHVLNANLCGRKEMWLFANQITCKNIEEPGYFAISRANVNLIFASDDILEY